jgi:hypothetical protein
MRVWTVILLIVIGLVYWKSHDDTTINQQQLQQQQLQQQQPVTNDQQAVTVVSVKVVPVNNNHKETGFWANFGMFFVGLATGYLLTWPGLIVLFILGILFEHNNESGWAIFTALVAIPVSYFFFAIPLTLIAYYALGYIAIGVVWSFYSYKRYITDQASIIRNSNMSAYQKSQCAVKLEPKYMLDIITGLIICWPFSAVDNLVSDLINSIQTLVKTVFKNIYYKIYSSVLGDLINYEEDNK